MLIAMYNTNFTNNKARVGLCAAERSMQCGDHRTRPDFKKRALAKPTSSMVERFPEIHKVLGVSRGSTRIYAEHTGADRSQLTGLLPLVALVAGDFLAPFFGGAAFFTEPFLVTNFLAAALLAGVFAFAPDLAFPFCADTKSWATNV